MEQNSGRRTGWQTALDFAVAPRTGFAALRAAPTWGWAFLIAAVLGMASTFAMNSIVGDTLGKEVRAHVEADPQSQQLSPDARKTLIERQRQVLGLWLTFSFALVPVGLAAGCALQALVMLIANAAGGGDGTFKSLWALAVNAGVVASGLGSVALAAIVLLRGRDGFGSAAEIANALPGLGSFVPPSAKAAAAFFGALNVFTLWDGVLLAAGMTAVARIPRGPAVAAALVIVLGAGVFPLLGAAFQK